MKSFSTRHSLTIGAIVILSLCLGGYYFIYIKGSQGNIRERNFRVLQRMSLNMVEKLKSYEILAGNYFNNVKDSVKNSSKSLRPSDNPKEMNRQFRDYASRHADKKMKFDTIINAKKDTAGIKFDFEEHDWKIVFMNRLDWYRTENTKQPAYFSVLKANMKDFFNPLMRKDVFNDFIVIKKDLLKNRIIFESFATGLSITNGDSIFNTGKGVETSTVKEFEIAGKNYKAFLQPVSIDPETTLIIVGLMTEESYKTQSSTFPSGIIVAVLICLLLLVLGMPFLKAVMISPNERLGTSDVILSGVSLLVGSSLVVFILFDSYIYFAHDIAQKENNLEILSDTVSSRFIDEIDATASVIDQYSSLMLGRPKESNEIYSYEKWKKENAGTIKALSGSVKIDQLFFVDSSGMQYLKYGSEIKVSVAERKYFTSALSGNLWETEKTKGVYVEPIISWTTGQFSVIVSRKTGDRKNFIEEKKKRLALPVAGASVSLRSVIDPALPIGYGFCIIREDGEVLFHSDRTKNLNENLFHECSGLPVLNSAAYARTKNTFNVRYSGVDCRMHIAPVGKLPLYVVTFFDKSYSRSVNTQVFGFTIILSFGLFIFIALQIFLVYFFKLRPSKLKIPDMELSTFMPVKRKADMYVRAVLYNISLFILLLFFIDSGRPLYTIYLFFISTVYAVWGNYLLIKSNEIFKLMSRHKVLSSIPLLLLVLLNIAACRVLDSYRPLLLLQVLILPVFFLFAQVLKNKKIVNHRLKFQVSYSFMILSLLALISVFPTLKFCEIAYNNEQKVITKYSQIDIARKVTALKKNAGKGACNNRNLYTGFVGDTVSLMDADEIKECSENKNEAEAFDAYTSELRPLYNMYAINNLFIQGDESPECSWKRNKDFIWLTYSDAVHHFNSDSVGAKADAGEVIIKSDLSTYIYPRLWRKNEGGLNFRNFLFWIAALIAFILLYCIITFFINKLFILDLLINKKLARVDREFFKDKQSNKRVFLTGLPYSGKTEYFNNSSACMLDLTDINNQPVWLEQIAIVRNTASPFIIIDHFEYNCNDLRVNQVKLDFLEEILKLRDKTILIISTLHPLGFLEVYDREDLLPAQKELYAQDKDRWNKLLINFYKFYYPLQGIIEEQHHHQQLELIDKECNNGLFLQKLKPALAATIKKQDLPKEEIILKIQSLAHSYYLSIWSLLTKEEQYVVYDLAQDGLVNPKNIEVITLLLNKGVLIHDGSLKIMNQSFRNFVLTVVKPEDALQIEKAANATGNWSKFRTPLIILIAAVSIFIFITQQNTFTNMLTYLTTITAGISLVVKLFGSFSSVNKA